jgi:chemotaxis protein histidine kinase CheA
MNIRSLYRISWALESLLQDIVNENVNDDKEVLEILIDAKRITDLLSQELNNYINHKLGR